MAPRKNPPAKRQPIKRKRRRPGNSSTGKVQGVEADQSTWRRKLQESRIKFDDPQKEIFLAAMRRHGLKGRAAEEAGVSTQTVRSHRDNDQEFNDAAIAAEETYRDFIAENVKSRAVVGDLKPIFYKGTRVTEPILDEQGVQMEDDDGKPRWRYAEVRERSDRMLELEAKRVEPAYRDKTQIDLTGIGGGVLLAPAGITPEQAVARNAALNEATEAAHLERMAEVEKAKKKVGAPGS